MEIEIQYPRGWHSSGDIFDAGNAFGDPWGNGSINFADLRMAYGGGIRWLSAMGPLRFEWGFPINPYEDERKMVFDFSNGVFVLRPFLYTHSQNCWLVMLITEKL